MIRHPAPLAVLIVTVLLGGCSSTPGPGKSKSTATPSHEEGPDASRAAQINVQLGLGYLQRGQKQAAADKLTRALEFDPRSPLANHAYALLQDVLGDTREAERYFQRALELDPKDAELLNNYGAFLCRDKRTDEGVEMLERAAANPLYATPEFAWSNIGQCRRQAGQLSEAEEALGKALKANSRHASSWLQLGEVQLALGQPAKAHTSLQRYHALAPQDPASLLLGARIERALGNREAQGHYELLLRGKFPDSDETRRLGEMSR
ncbi:MAG: type IV pilus biogenesis/stability protein PilW [Pseudomonadota bacterium]